MSHISLTTATDAEVMATLGTRLAALRESQGLTRSEAAKQSGLGRRTVFRAERGQNPTLLSIVRLLRLYGRLDALGEMLATPEISPLALLEKNQRGRRG
jgi:transcriptional regulator with XRE-family HTH domain